MKISFNWLKDYITFKEGISTEDLIWRLTEASAEVEELEKAFTYQAELKDACQRKVVPIQLIPTVTKKKRKLAKKPRPNRKLTEAEQIRNDLVIKQKLIDRLLEKK